VNLITKAESIHLTPAASRWRLGEFFFWHVRSRHTDWTERQREFLSERIFRR
jgi:hypothetical protein